MSFPTDMTFFTGVELGASTNLVPHDAQNLPDPPKYEIFKGIHIAHVTFWF